jgi:hypothetical protein
MDIGYRRFSTTGNVTDPNGLDQAFVRFNVLYGDQMTDLNKAPFRRSSCKAPWRPIPILGEPLRTSLYAADSGPGRWAIDSVQLAGFMTYDYISNEVIDFGGQGFMGGIIAQSDRAKRFSSMVRRSPVP